MVQPYKDEVYSLDEVKRSVVQDRLDALEDLLYQFCELMESSGEDTIIDRTNALRDSLQGDTVTYTQLLLLQNAITPFKAWYQDMEAVMHDMYATLRN